jgi:hypothetical protein
MHTLTGFGICFNVLIFMIADLKIIKLWAEQSIGFIFCLLSWKHVSSVMGLSTNGTIITTCTKNGQYRVR